VAKGVRGEPADLRSAGSDVEVQGGKPTWGRGPGRWGTRKGGEVILIGRGWVLLGWGTPEVSLQAEAAEKPLDLEVRVKLVGGGLGGDEGEATSQKLAFRE
jgi:hypothetical protein